MRGDVCFNLDNTVKVKLNYGRYPLHLGLTPTVTGRKFKVEVSVVSQSELEDDWELDTIVSNMNETNLPEIYNGQVATFGAPIETISCDDLESRGFVENDQVLFRYIIIANIAGNPPTSQVLNLATFQSLVPIHGTFPSR